MKYSKWRGLCGILSLAGSLAMLGCGVNGNSFVRAVNASPGLANYTVTRAKPALFPAFLTALKGYSSRGIIPPPIPLEITGPWAPGTASRCMLYSTPGTNLASTTQSFIKSTPYTIVLESHSAGIPGC